MTAKGGRRGEFELIARLFAPLAREESGAFGLTDDVAALTPKPGQDIVLTTDAIVAGVHFFANDPPETIAQKALRVNLSDLAAKGAVPRAYLLTLAVPPSIGDAWLKAFAGGLKRDQTRFAITLIGGDTVATPGPVMVNIAALGEVAHGKTVRRAGAKAGDEVWVSGTIGDAALGLRLLKGEHLGLSEQHAARLIGRFRVPEPRLGLGQAIGRLAHACLDVSDGLVADLGHIAETSAVGIEIDAGAVPFSAAAREAIANGRAKIGDLITGGDDYELAFAAPASAAPHLTAASAKAKVALSRIGRVVRGKSVAVIGPDGKRLVLPRAGYTHF